MSTLRIAHISDLHFFEKQWSPLQFFSKRWLGNVNALWNRRETFTHDRLSALTDLFVLERISHVIISGDLTTTSHQKELAKAAAFADVLQKKGISVFTLPGNHDQYTRSAYKKKLFYRYFPSLYSHEFPFNLMDHGITALRLQDRWHLILLDTAIATSWFSSRGLFSREMEAHLEELLVSLPPHSCVLLASHFPFFQNESPRKLLMHGERLMQLMQRHPSIRFYLHGHTHRQVFADLRPSGLPLVLDPGSTTQKAGGWNCIEIGSKHIQLLQYSWQEGWKLQREQLIDSYG